MASMKWDRTSTRITSPKYGCRHWRTRSGLGSTLMNMTEVLAGHETKDSDIWQILAVARAESSKTESRETRRRPWKGGRSGGCTSRTGGDNGSATDESTAPATGRRVEAAPRGRREAGGVMTGRANGTAEQAGRRRDGGPLQMDDVGRQRAAPAADLARSRTRTAATTGGGAERAAPPRRRRERRPAERRWILDGRI